MLKKHSPEILTAVSVVCGIAGVIDGCKKSMVLAENLEPAKRQIDVIKESAEAEGVEVDKKELTKAYGTAAVAVCKTYASTVALEATAVVCELAAIGILKKRNAGLTSAYILLDEVFKKYRANVVEELGEDKDYQFYHGLKKEKVKVSQEDPETGKVKTVTEEVYVKKDTGLSGYAILFDSSNVNYTDNAMLNQSFIEGIRRECIRKFRREGILYLSDVYERLGYDYRDLNEHQKKASRVVGWKMTKEREEMELPIDFYVFDKINERANSGIANNDSSAEPVFILDFDVDGIIMDPDK